MNKHLPSKIKPATKTHILVVAKQDLSAFHRGSRSVVQSLVTRSGGAHRRYLSLVQAAEQYADARHLSLVVTRDEPPRFYADGNELVVKEFVPLTSTSNHDN